VRLRAGPLGLGPELLVTAAFIGPDPRRAWALVVGAATFALLSTGVYRWIERSLMALVALLSAVFLTTAVTTMPRVSYCPSWPSSC
jgi:Mn2+/Fe2+ NRAMP family transporter